MANETTRKCAHIPCLCEYPRDNSIAEMPVVKREAKMWKSRVSATIWRVR